ncbi:sigma factor-like helix-turn-helix DNA-binding protein [uncultured Gemmiger sp.]|uniref:sigma factor-like helix-turn-helix DNA-binding protein n=1 Tax=uncultured Gemmiger sp. TaxID=1623490 RepID=UPI0025D52548|nr:sigma factor-like helix-turn-helix DNA-binding protein [uncultured Gemmiger sp.]
MAPKSQKNLTFSVLLDYYGPVLTEKQRAILTEYYDQDLSLAEIAENYGITRQGVRDAIKHGEATLTEMEQNLGYAEKDAAQRADLARLEQLVMEIRCCNTGLFTPVPQITRDTDEILAILKRLNT